MRTINLILQAIASVAKQLWLLPHTVARAARQWRGQGAADMMEAERLDRIRNPSKYLGKS